MSSSPENDNLWMVLTLCLLRRFHFLFYGKSFPGVNDVDYRTRSCGFEIFQKCPSMTTVRIRGVDALGREVIEFLKVSVPMQRWLGNDVWAIV